MPSIGSAPMLEALRQAGSADPRARLYLLLDPYLRQPPQLEAEWAGRETAGVKLRPRDRIPASKRPLLMQFRSDGVLDDEGLLQDTLEMGWAESSPDREFSGAGRLFGGWLLSTAPIRAVAEHLRAIMEQRLPSGAPRYVRLADPRVLNVLWRQLSAAERRSLLGPISDWWIFDHVGSWTRLGQGQAADTTDRWRPTPEQWQLIDRMQLVNGVVLRLRREDPSAMPDLARIDALVRSGQARGFTDADDLRTFAACGLRYGESFFGHPRVASLLAGALAEPRALEDAFADEATDEEWRQIAKGANHMEPVNKGALSSHG